MMGIILPETRWAYKKYNKIISDILLVFHSSFTYFILIVAIPTCVYLFIQNTFQSKHNYILSIIHAATCFDSESSAG